MKRWLVLLLLSIKCFAQEPTVVCIHGFMTSARSMKPIENSLRAFGIHACSWEYESRRRTIQQHGYKLACFLSYVASRNPGVPIDFVTHSTGGLVLRAALNDPCCPEEAKVGRAVLLAPPNRGSVFARYFRNVPPVTFFMGDKSGWQLMNWCPGDIVNCLGSFPPTMEVLVIAGTSGNCIFFDEPNDGYLTTCETAMETPYYWMSYPVSHGDMLAYPKVLCCLRSFLYYGPTQHSQCTQVEEVHQ